MRIWLCILCLFPALVWLAFSGPAPALGADAPRKSVLAGTWYPGDPAELEKSIKTWLDRAEIDKPRGRVIGIISPHAGHVYSGPVAASAFKTLIDQKIDTAVIIGPSHRLAFAGVSLNEPSGYQTPLGLVRTDLDFTAELKKTLPDLKFIPEAHAREHSVEIQLPFLQIAVPGARMAALIMGDQDMRTCRMLAHGLAQCVRKFPDKRIIIIASTDLSHFHSSDQAGKIDANTLKRVRDFSAHGLAECLAKGQCEACGGGPVITAMLAAKELGADNSLVLAYADSSLSSGDRDRVVGYLAAAFTQTGRPQKNNPDKAESAQRPAEFSPADRSFLLDLARKSIDSALAGKDFAPGKPPSPLLNEKRGAFVTLKIHGRLRGCIGRVIGRDPLVRTIAEMARAAAFEDPRFSPLTRKEFPNLEIEISVLTQPKAISDPALVKVGTHGLIMRRGFNAGLLLPQVPLEYGWDRETFLDNTCRKAGMESGCWRDPDTKISVFSAEVF